MVEILNITAGGGCPLAPKVAGPFAPRRTETLFQPSMRSPPLFGRLFLVPLTCTNFLW